MSGTPMIDVLPAAVNNSVPGVCNVPADATLQWSLGRLIQAQPGEFFADMVGPFWRGGGAVRIEQSGNTLTAVVSACEAWPVESVMNRRQFGIHVLTAETRLIVSFDTTLIAIAADGVVHAYEIVTPLPVVVPGQPTVPGTIGAAIYYWAIDPDADTAVPLAIVRKRGVVAGAQPTLIYDVRCPAHGQYVWTSSLQDAQYTEINTIPVPSIPRIGSPQLPTVTVSHGPFLDDLGVSIAGALALRVPVVPAYPGTAGQYAVTVPPIGSVSPFLAVYTFAAADQRKAVDITYSTNEGSIRAPGRAQGAIGSSERYGLASMTLPQFNPTQDTPIYMSFPAALGSTWEIGANVVPAQDFTIGAVFGLPDLIAIPAPLSHGVPTLDITALLAAANSEEEYTLALNNIRIDGDPAALGGFDLLSSVSAVKHQPTGDHVHLKMVIRSAVSAVHHLAFAARADHRVQIRHLQLYARQLSPPGLDVQAK